MVKFMRKVKGLFVTLIEISIHLIECISGHNSGVLPCLKIEAPRVITIIVIITLLDVVVHFMG